MSDSSTSPEGQLSNCAGADLIADSARQDLTKKIKVCIEKAERHDAKANHAAKKAEEFYIAAGQYINELEDRWPDEWLEIVEEDCGLKRSRIYEIRAIGDGRTSVEKVRSDVAKRVRDHRERMASPLQNVCNGQTATKPAVEAEVKPTYRSLRARAAALGIELQRDGRSYNLVRQDGSGRFVTADRLEYVPSLLDVEERSSAKAAEVEETKAPVETDDPAACADIEEPMPTGLMVRASEEEIEARAKKIKRLAEENLAGLSRIIDRLTPIAAQAILDANRRAMRIMQELADVLVERARPDDPQASADDRKRANEALADEADGQLANDDLLAAIAIFTALVHHVSLHTRNVHDLAAVVRELKADAADATPEDRAKFLGALTLLGKIAEAFDAPSPTDPSGLKPEGETELNTDEPTEMATGAASAVEEAQATSANSDTDLEGDDLEEDEEPERPKRRPLKMTPYERKLADAIGSAIEDLNELAEQTREIVDGAPDNLRETERIQTLEMSADSLENIEVPDVPDVLAEIVVPFSLPKRRYVSRASQAADATSILQACIEKLWVIAEDDTLNAEAQQLADDLDEIVNAAANCEFPGMYG
jgi:hypothetical protein